MMKTNRRALFAIWAGLYAASFVGCTSEDNAGAEQNGGATADQEETGSGGIGGSDSLGLGGSRETNGGTGEANGGTTTASGGSSDEIFPSGAGGNTAGTEQGGSGGIITAPVVGKSLSALKKVDNCDDVLMQIKQRLRQEAEETIEANLQQVLDNMENGMYCGLRRLEEPIALNGADMASGGQPPAEEGASEYSTTNVQVVGVDEADFVKNDDSYIYVVADGRLQIIDAWPAAEAHTIASVEIRGEPKKLYVEGNRAVVYSSLDPIDPGDPTLDYDMFMPMIGLNVNGNYQKECTYGYNCDFSGDGRELLIQIYNISDKTSPILLRETELSGSYLNSRRIGDIVHTVATFPEIAVPGLVYWPEELLIQDCSSAEDFPFTEDEVREAFAALEMENEKVIDEATITDFLPGIKDTRYVGMTPTVEEGLLNSCDNFYVSQAGDGRGFLALISFNMNALGAINATTIVGKPGAVYASSESLYVAVRHYSSMMRSWYFDDREENEEATTIHKFRLSPDSISTTYAGSGVAKGRILNQFSMDELNGYLRIATSSGHVPDPNVHSTLSVLTEQEGWMEVVGMVDDIAPTEDIRSVRFNGEVGFIVTFKKTDPLFVIDLSDPTDPVIKAELKVPGFATYMHLMDDTHLMTMGYDAEDMDSFAWFQGIQLRVLDVSELENPTVLSEETIGTRGSSSDAATNHLAFNYFPQRDLLAIPMTLCEGSAGGGSYGNIMTFSGLLVYRVTVENGFDLMGGVPHEEPETADNYGIGCSNWWTDSNSKVKRSIFMSSDTEDFVYSIAMDLINISNLKDLEHPLTSIELID